MHWFGKLPPAACIFRSSPGSFAIPWVQVLYVSEYKKDGCFCNLLFSGAGDEARTRYLHLGKVALYRMSYTRICRSHYSNSCGVCQEKFYLFLFFLP